MRLPTAFFLDGEQQVGAVRSVFTALPLVACVTDERTARNARPAATSFFAADASGLG